MDGKRKAAADDSEGSAAAQSANKHRRKLFDKLKANHASSNSNSNSSTMLLVTPFSSSECNKDTLLCICGFREAIGTFIDNTDFFGADGLDCAAELGQYASQLSPSNSTSGGSAAVYWRPNKPKMVLMAVSRVASRHNCACRPDQIKALIATQGPHPAMYVLLIAEAREHVLPMLVAVVRNFPIYNMKSRQQAEGRVTIALYHK